MKLRCCYAVSLLAIVLGCVAPAYVWGQSGLPAGWENLSAAEFAAQMRDVESRPVSESELQAVRTRAKSLLLTGNLLQTEADYRVLESVHHVVRHQLNDDEKAQIRSALEARQDDWTDKPYASLRAKVALMHWVGTPVPRLAVEGLRWKNAGGDVSQIEGKDLTYAHFLLGQPQIILGDFVVRWEGTITAPQTAQYKFFISPIDVNGTRTWFDLKQSLTIAINGAQVLSATPDNWDTESNAVQLTAGQPVPINVELVVNRTADAYGLLHAILAWQSTGGARTIVPSQALRLPDGSAAGLRATYEWKSNGQVRTTTRTEPNIDIAWTSGKVAIGANLTAQRQGAQALYQASMQPDVLAAHASGAGGRHPLVVDPEFAAEGLTSAQRRTFLQEVVNRPALLDGLSAELAMELYRGYRFGAGNQSLDAWGKWATENADLQCALPSAAPDWTFDRLNRSAAFEMAICVTQQFAPHAERLQAEFLELPDGRCSLPVAYTLSYSHLSKGTLDNWIAFLDEKLAQQSVAGDIRVNWLLARAHAHGIRLGRAEPFQFPAERAMDARGLIEEAILVAESPTVKLRAVFELAARLAFVGRQDEALELLETRGQNAPDALRAELATWRTAIGGLGPARQQLHADQAAAAQDSYRARIQQRREAAAARGDTRAVQRYDGILAAQAPR